MYDDIVLSKIQVNILHYVAGYLIRSISRIQKVCKQCILCTGDFKQNLYFYNKLSYLRCYGDNTLFFVNFRTLKFFIQMEKIFIGTMKNIKSLNNINLHYFMNKFLEIPYFLPECHNLKRKIACRYAVFRLKIRSKKIAPNQSKTFASKTMAMHALVA